MVCVVGCTAPSLIIINGEPRRGAGLLRSLNLDPSGIVGGQKNVKLKLPFFWLILHSKDCKQTLPHQVLQTGKERREYRDVYSFG